MCYGRHTTNQRQVTVVWYSVWSVLSWRSPSSSQSGAPDAGYLLTPRADHGSTHPSLNTAEPGQLVSGSFTQRCLNEGQSGVPDAESSHLSKTGHTGTHRSAFDAASPGDCSVLIWPARETPSQGHLTLGVSSH